MHEPLPLPPPPDFDLSDEEPTQLRIRGVDADVYMAGVERRIETNDKRAADALAQVNKNIAALSAKQDEANRVAKSIQSDIADLRDSVSQIAQWLRERDQQEQPRTVARKGRK